MKLNAASPQNVNKLRNALEKFGCDTADATMFIREIIRRNNHNEEIIAPLQHARNLRGDKIKPAAIMEPMRELGLKNPIANMSELTYNHIWA